MFVEELNSIIDLQTEKAKMAKEVLRESLSSIRIEDGFATILSGVRRCGKSTLMRQFRHQDSRSSLSLDFDDFRLSSFTSADFKVLDAVIERRHPEVLYFDEIQSIAGWELYIRQQLSSGMKCMVSGSNASMLGRELGTKLTGRHLDYTLTPFSFSEFLQYTEQESDVGSFLDYMRRGGFPGYLASGNNEILRTLVDDILYRDISVRYGINDINLLRRLCVLLFSLAGCFTNPSNLCQALHVKSATTMLEYFSYLEQSYLIERLLKYSDSSKAQMLAPKKIYVVDTSLVYATHASNSPNLGHVLENIVYNHIRRKYPLLNYFNDGECECDFVCRDESGDCAVIQVCWELTEENRIREFNGLLHAMKCFGLKSGTIITCDQSDYGNIDGLEVVIRPARDFLLES